MQRKQSACVMRISVLREVKPPSWTRSRHDDQASKSLVALNKCSLKPNHVANTISENNGAAFMQLTLSLSSKKIKLCDKET